ncbi:MAG: CrcB protein [Mycobacterium sp.]|jgi:CrcB protein|nr:CrcB protein [Mycobacterium sp.]
MIVLVMSLAGGLGAVARFALDGLVVARAGRRFPYGTLLINISGSLLLGVLTGLTLAHGAPTALRTVAGTGFCGGYTTFSTASFETVRLLQERRWAAALTNGAGTLVLTLLAAALGLWVTGAL